MTRSTNRLLAAGLLALGVLLPLRPAAGQASPQWSGEGYGKNKIQYRDFDWKIYRSPHFNVHYYTSVEPSLQKVVSFAESAYDQLARELNFQIKDPVPLIYYGTHSAFEQNNIILNFIPEGVGAFASPARFRMVLPIDLPDSELMELILHELTHIFQYHMLFQGSLAKAVATAPPTWFMEGMASYMAKDETERDKMFLRDAVVNDRIPSVTQTNFGGFFAYRFGHAVFDFIEERWGRDGFLDFIYEIRNTIGSRVDRAVERAFKMKPEDFDLEFRRWLRKKYLPKLVETGEPGDFGRVFRLQEGRPASEVISPTASPSGDLVAAFTVYAGEIDISLFNTQTRRLVRNLTSGFSNEYQYLVGQELALGRKMGRDIDFSPDGNTLAVFAKREKGRSLLLLDVLNGGIRQIIDMEGLEQQSAPSWSPDGTKIAFSGWKNGQFDIFLLDVESRTITNFTNDDIFDGAPDFSPDGGSLVYVSVTGDGFAKLFRSEMGNPGQRFQITTGESNENDPIYSPDGQRIYFTSDRAGADNIFSLNVAKGEVRQYTDVVSGAFMPTVLPAAPAGEDAGQERLVYTGFWKGNFDLYVTDVDEPVEDPQTVEVPVEPTSPENVARFEPDIQVTIDEANKEKYGGYKFFLEDARSVVGVDSDQTLLGQVVLTFSDYLGDRRIFAALSSVESFSNFNILYADLSRRWQWQVLLFDDRSYYLGRDFIREDRPFERIQQEYQVTGAIGSIVYPFTFYQRAEFGLGYIYRKIAYPTRQPGGVQDPRDVQFVEFSDDFPLLQGALVGDSTIFANYGAVGGRRWRLDLQYGPNLGGGSGEDSTLFASADLDVRQYIPVTRRSNLALRGFAGIAGGELPTPFRFGGLDTIRGTRFYEFTGDRAFFANVEYRFPLIDVIATPLFVFQGVRGNIFFDVGGAWYDEFEEFDFYNSDEGRLEDATAAYGFGVTVRFIGIDLNWDFARVTKFADDEDSNFETSFWIGTRF
ncbi:MAG TPA: collagenase [Thermoanaerobaculia bacterium]|nr:collagenase [Thermoanaerobaculia bacterium]